MRVEFVRKKNRKRKRQCLFSPKGISFFFFLHFSFFYHFSPFVDASTKCNSKFFFPFFVIFFFVVLNGLLELHSFSKRERPFVVGDYISFCWKILFRRLKSKKEKKRTNKQEKGSRKKLLAAKCNAANLMKATIFGEILFVSDVSH